MKTELVIAPDLKEPEVIIRAAAMTPALEALAEELRLRQIGGITAVRDGEAFFLSRTEIFRFFTQGKGVFCQTAEGVFSVRQRLYELEEHLAGTRFVRVSHSEIINLDRVTALDLSISGTIRITLAGSVTTYASRRCVKKLKQAAGLLPAENTFPTGREL